MALEIQYKMEVFNRDESHKALLEKLAQHDSGVQVKHIVETGTRRKKTVVTSQDLASLQAARTALTLDSARRTVAAVPEAD